MKLTDLEPRWLMKDGARVGFVFRCPTNQTRWQSCFVESPPFREQCKLIANAFGDWDDEDRDYGRPNVQTAREGVRWTISGEFEGLTVTPSIRVGSISSLGTIRPKPDV